MSTSCITERVTDSDAGRPECEGAVSGGVLLLASDGDAGRDAEGGREGAEATGRACLRPP